MGIFDRFPYSSTHEMNLDYMLGKATEIAEDMQQVTAGMEQVQAGLSAISEKTEQATQAAAQAAQSASSIEGSVTAAEEAAEEAQMHNESAQTWANNALTYKADCQRAATEAAASSSSAAQAATAAAASKDTVATYAQAANASAQSAANNNDSAHQYANQASASASNATFHSSNAQTAATNANTSATNAETAATNAQTAATRAATLKDDVETLHRMCTAAVDQAATEAVNAANSAAQAAATKTDVENLVESLPEDFTDLNNTVNQLSDEIDASNISQSLSNITMITGGYINTSGNIAATEDFSYSEFIESENIVSVYACMGYNVAVLAYYNAQRQFIGYLDTTTSDEYISKWWDFAAPVGTKFIRFSNRKNLPNTDVKIKKIINVETLSASTKASGNKLQYINNDIIPATVDLSVGLPGIVNYAGQLINTEYHSNPITLKRGETVYFTCRSSNVIAPIARLVSGYDRYAVLVVGVNENDHTYTYTAFEDMQIVLSWYGSHPHYATITRVYSIVDIDDSIQDIESVDYSACVSRILCIGDSLTAGALFLNSATNYVGDNAKSYPYFLSKEMNIQCVNKGSDGATPELWFSRLYTETVFDDYDCLLLWLGTNHGLSDTLETDVDPYDDYHNYTGNTGKYCRIIEEFKAKTNNAPVFLIKVFDGGYDTETGITKEITNSVIDKIAQKYNVPTIETAEFLYQSPPKGYSELAVKIHGVNELHFNTFGNMYIAHHFHEAMKAYWKNNTDKMDAAYRLKGNGLPWWMEH